MNILNLKKQSALKFIQNQLKIVGKKEKIVPENLTHIGIIADLKLWETFDFLKNLGDYLNIPSEKFKVILLNFEETENNDLPFLSFSEKDLGMFGKIKNKEVVSFVKKDFDLLINYSSLDNYLVQLLVLQSEAKLKAGFYKEKAVLYDISIKLSENKILVFNEELGRYLTIMGFLE